MPHTTDLVEELSLSAEAATDAICYFTAVPKALHRFRARTAAPPQSRLFAAAAARSYLFVGEPLHVSSL